MAIEVSYGMMKAPKKVYRPSQPALNFTPPVSSTGTGTVIPISEIPRLLTMQSMNQLQAIKKDGPKLLPHAVYKARLGVLAICRNYGFVPGRMVTTLTVASRHGKKLTEVAINDCAIVSWCLEAYGDQAWRPLRCEWFDNTVTYHEHVNLVLITTPKAEAA